MDKRDAKGEWILGERKLKIDGIISTYEERERNIRIGNRGEWGEISTERQDRE